MNNIDRTKQALATMPEPMKEVVKEPGKEMSLVETLNLGQVLASSGMFTDVRTQAQAVVKILAGRELGIGPILALTKIYMVKGKVTLAAEVMAGLIKKSGEYNYVIVKHDNNQCFLSFQQKHSVDNKWVEIGQSVFTMADAQKAGVADGVNWKQYPRNMLFARAISNGARWYCPHIIAGAYTPEEMTAAVDGQTGEIITGNGGQSVEEAPLIKAPQSKKKEKPTYTVRPSKSEGQNKPSKAEKKATPTPTPYKKKKGQEGGITAARGKTAANSKDVVASGEKLGVLARTIASKVTGVEIEEARTELPRGLKNHEFAELLNYLLSQKEAIEVSEWVKKLGEVIKSEGKTENGRESNLP